MNVQAGCVVDKPIEVLFLSLALDDAILSQPRSLVVLEAGASATLVERYASPGRSVYFNNALVEVLLQEDARLQHYRVQEESLNAYHLSALHVHLAHWPPRANEYGRALRLQLAAIALLTVRGGNVRPLIAEEGDIVVMQPPHICIHHAVQRLLANHVHRSPAGDVTSDIADLLCRTGIEHNNIIKATAVCQFTNQGRIITAAQPIANDNSGGCLSGEFLHRLRYVGQHDRGRRIKP